MIALVQRVSGASVRVDGSVVAEIGRGVLIFAGIMSADDEDDLMYCARKCAELRIFPDPDGAMNLSVCDVGGEVMVVSQFTLCARVRKGRRPSFDRAMQPDRAEEMLETFVGFIEHFGLPVKSGVFGAKMAIDLCNDGPVTIIVDSKEKR